MERGVCGSIDILCTTLNNAGSEFTERGFDCSTLIIDEGAGLFPTPSIPVISLDDWKGGMMFGDPQQLPPTYIHILPQRNKHMLLQRDKYIT